MRIIFAGTAGFAVASLRAANARHAVVAVVTQPDRAGNRGRPAPRPVAETAEVLHIPILQPERIRRPEAVEHLQSLAADALVVAAYGQIIPAALLDGFAYGGINVHASLLPRWRGASPVAHAILAGDAETGVAIMGMEAGLDTGPVYATRRLALGPDARTPAITEMLAVAGAEELVGVLAALERGVATATPQLQQGVTLAPRLTREMGMVDWSRRSAVDVDRMVRALLPWPGVRAPLAGVEVGVVSGSVVDGGDAARSPGDLLAVGPDGVDVVAAPGVYRIAEVKPPDRRSMSAADFLRGRHR